MALHMHAPRHEHWLLGHSMRGELAHAHLHRQGSYQMHAFLSSKSILRLLCTIRADRSAKFTSESCFYGHDVIQITSSMSGYLFARATIIEQSLDKLYPSDEL